MLVIPRFAFGRSAECSASPGLGIEWRDRDSNPRPPAYEAGELPAALPRWIGASPRNEHSLKVMDRGGLASNAARFWGRQNKRCESTTSNDTGVTLGSQCFLRVSLCLAGAVAGHTQSGAAHLMDRGSGKVVKVGAAPPVMGAGAAEDRTHESVV